MRVLELSLRNYRVFEEVDLELPPRVIGIFGENGAGKSALMEGIAVGLYGVDAARTKKQGIRTHGLLADCEIRVIFEHGGHQYEIRRSLRGKNATPEAELFAGDLLLATGTTEVDAEVRRLLHMDLHVFRASVFAEQGQLDAFSEVTAGKRKEMALRLLGIKPVDDARASARREAKGAKEQAGQLEEAVADIAALEAELKGAREDGAAARVAAKDHAKKLKVFLARSKTARIAFDRIESARQRVGQLTVELIAKTDERARVAEQHRQLVDRVEQLEAELAELPDLEKQLAGLAGAPEELRAAERLAESEANLQTAQARLAAVPKVDEATSIAHLEAVRTEHASAQREASDREARREHEWALLEAAQERLARAAEADPSQPCPTCGRPLGDDFASYLKHCKQEVAASKTRVKQAERSSKDARAASAKADAAVRAASKAREHARASFTRRAQLAEQAEILRAEREMLAGPFGKAAPDLPAIRQRVSRAGELENRVAVLATERKHLVQAQRDLASAEGLLAKLGALLEALSKEAEGLAFDAGEHERLLTERDEADAALEAERVAERAASDALKDAERAVGALEGELKQARETAAKVDEIRVQARHVERVAMLLDGFRDHLVSRIGPDLSREAEALFRELTNHEYDDLRIDDETLSIQIADGDAYHPIERFSGSETDLANLALRVAISSHLSRVSGADIGLLVLDEVLGSLDEERKDLMVQTLSNLAARFHQLFVITHAEQAKDHFPASVEVRKVARRRSTAELA